MDVDRRHILSQDVFRALMRIEARREWSVTEADVAASLHLPTNYVRNAISTSSQFVGPGPGAYDPNPRLAAPHVPVLHSGPAREVHFTPDHVIPHETYRHGRASERTCVYPSLSRSSPVRRKGPSTATTAKTPPRRRRGVPEVIIHEPSEASLPAIGFSFPQADRPSNASSATPEHVSAATYDPRPLSKPLDVEPSRMIVGFHSSLAREPQWMPNPDRVTHDEIYRDRLQRQTRAAKSILETTAPSVVAGDRSFSGATGAGPRKPSFDPFEWAHLQTMVETADGSNPFLIPPRVSTPEYFRRGSADATPSALALPDDDRRAPITCHFPNGLSLTFRIGVARAVRDLKVAIAKKLSARPTLETKHLDLRGQDVQPNMLVLYFHGKALDDKALLTDAGLEDRSHVVVAFDMKSK
ncbi:hypothetical protein SPRG_04967 [Saprolegnia parasitica CBS 223.65]|uniref:Ubiquitin-like domain-containing protein n=1 Tax=Saprolegnia parasitica (strain CBS 223.65) TaxID=695850 RepID=A0A067CTN7_SAPPC|nr:hypothetical protein SPRG_04967 [Saprolegnia parasitica CBS 223.65]KDO29901.1 hypothetical protein SPRG_04967 [Saprolegnia parasitica CBS 223.65]|eukprot:XP_012199495.1 hypothetical protein SPRG_04967 [Saprolegnia parasitica CBS 223.65]